MPWQRDPDVHRTLKWSENEGEGERRASQNSEGEREGWGETKAGKESGKRKIDEQQKTGECQRETGGCENPNCVIFTAGV